MAFVAGRSTKVLCDGYDVSAYLRSVTLSLSWDLTETTTFGNAGKTRIATLNDASLSASGLWDPTQDGIAAAALSGVASSVVSFMPTGGASVGDRAWVLAAATTSYEPASEVGGAVAFDWSAESRARVAVGAVLHPLGEDTNTTTGSSRDDSAATSTGWVAALHVTAVDGGSWVVKLQDSADDSSWSDVSGGALTAATGATGERIASSSATATLRRYVRYVATRTGGSAGDGITFALAYARTA